MQVGSRLYTDSASSYRALQGYVHAFVNHTKKEYARGDVHENRAECLFSLLKPYLRVFRGIGGNTLTRANLSTPPASPTGTERLDRDVLEQAGVTHIILFLGIRAVIICAYGN